MPPVSFYESGHGFPVVFLHGFCESNSLWKSLSTNLSDEFRIICPDLPGFGKSKLPANDFSLEEIGDILIAFLKDIGVKQSIIIGHSLGGYISLEILRKHADFVQAIGLFNSSAFEDTPDKKEIRNKLIEFIDDHGVEPFLKTFVPSLFYPKTAKNHEKIINQISKEGMSILPAAVMKYAAAMRDRMDSVDLLKKYHDRILLIAGEFDLNVPLAKSKEMSKILDQVNTCIIPESAHMSVVEQPMMCYDAIRKFVRKFS